MDIIDNASTSQVIDFKQLNQEVLDNSKSHILKIDTELDDQIEAFIQTWLENQKAKKLYNAINSVVSPIQSLLPVEDFSALIEQMVKTYSRIINDGKSDQYDQSLDLSGFGLKEAIFTVLKYRRQSPTFDEIINDLEKLNFKPKAENHRESVRTMLRYYSDKKSFMRIDESETWSLTADGEKLFTTDSDVSESPDTETTLTTVSDVEAVNTNKPKDHKLYSYVRIMRESGLEEMHVDEIADIFNQQFNANISGHNVGSSLSRNSRTKNPFVMRSGKNIFKLTNSSTKLAADEADIAEQPVG